MEIKRTIPREAIPGARDFKTKKIFVGGIPTSVTEGVILIIGFDPLNGDLLLIFFPVQMNLEIFLPNSEMS